MIGHQAKRPEALGDRRRRVCPGLEEGAVVAVFVEVGAPGIAPVEDVVTNAADRGSCCTWHWAEYIAAGATPASKKMNVPFSP
jgi:hypothetical protein